MKAVFSVLSRAENMKKLLQTSWYDGTVEKALRLLWPGRTVFGSVVCR